MKLINQGGKVKSLIKRFNPNKSKGFYQISSPFLVITGTLSFIITSCLSLVIRDIAPPLAHYTNKSDTSFPIIVLWLQTGIYSTFVWYYGCIAMRCSKLLYDRWFE